MKRAFVLGLLLTIVGLLGVRSQTQTVLLDAEKHNQITYMCDGEFYDNSKNGNYATNFDYWTTICPAQASSRIKLEFDMFEVHPSDTLIVYYGKSITDERALNQDNEKDYFQNNDLEGKSISAPITDTSGCLTIRFRSNKFEVAKGWKARTSCEAVCQDVYVALAPTFTKYDVNGKQSTRPVRDGIDFDTLEVKDPNFGFDITKTDEQGNVSYYRIDTVKFKAIDICEGDSVVLTAAPDFRYNDQAYHQTPQNCIYIWGFGDSDTGYDTVYYNPTIGHKWTKVSGYDLRLYITDTSHGGCVGKNSLSGRVRIAQNPIKMENNIADMCSGDKQPINVDYSGTSTIVLDSFHVNQAEREYFDTRKFIPDGGSATGGNASYESSITFSSFSAGASISQGKEIADVCINMEHSSIGDIGIELRCPDNKSVTLKYNDKYKSGKKRYFMGVPLGSVSNAFMDPTTADNTNILDTNKNKAGECWQYCWSNTYLANAQGVLSGRIPNIVRNYTVPITGVPLVNNIIDSTHFWGTKDTITVTTSVPADTIHIYENSVIKSKGKDTIFATDGDFTAYNTNGQSITIQNGDTYASTSTGREFIYTESIQTNVYEQGVQMIQYMPIVDNGGVYPPNYGDTVEYHTFELTTYSGGTATTLGYGSTFQIDVVGGNISATIDGFSSIVDSIKLVRSDRKEFRPFKNDTYYAHYNDYVRTVSYSYDWDSIASNGDTSQFLQTPKQGVTGNTAFNWSSTTQTQAYTDATTVDLSGFDKLIGCPLNGTWTIRITDNMKDDNGWICGWWIDIDLSPATDWTYSVPIDTVIWGGPFITQSKATSAVVAPPVAQSGVFTYNVQVIDDFGCSWPAKTQVSVVETPIVKLGPDKQICEGEQVTLNAGNPGAARYDWEPTGETTQTITFTPQDNEFGTKTFVAMVTNNNGKLYCYGKDTIKVNVHPAAAASFSSVKFPMEGCEPYTVELLSASSEAKTYEWTVGDLKSNEENPTFTLPAGTYDLNLKVKSQYGCSDELHIDNAISVFPSLTADFAWKPENPYSSDPSAYMVNLTEPRVDSVNQFVWTFQTNKNNTLDVENVVGFEPYYTWVAQENENVAGEYTITLDAYSYNTAPSGKTYECHDTISKVITIINDNIIFPTVITPNGDGINDIFEIHNLITGQAYPDNELAIYNRYGKRIYFVQDLRSADQFWDPAKTKSPTGTYFYHFVAKGPIKNVEFNGTVEVLDSNY